MNHSKIAEIIGVARKAGRDSLLEEEGLRLLSAIGIRVPHSITVGPAGTLDSSTLDALRAFKEKIVLKAVCPGLMHKTEAGAVKILPNEPDLLRAEISKMKKALTSNEGFLIEEFVTHDSAFGNEWLFGVSHNHEFGPVVTLSPGGVQSEYLAKALEPNRRLKAFTADSPFQADQLAGIDLVTRPFRGKEAALALSEFEKVTQQLQAFLAMYVPNEVIELEINPLVVSAGTLVAVDVVCRLAESTPAPVEAQNKLQTKPLEKVKALLQPESIAIVGVSERMNPGRVILKNILKAGFSADKILIVKEGLQTLDGCHCIANLEQKVDLLILAVSAEQIPAIIEKTLSADLANAVMIIPGGLEEKQGGEKANQLILDSLAQSRLLPLHGPLLNGGNCLGIRSLPGRYNSMFIPEEKLPTPQTNESEAALISQSGAFVISRMNHLAHLNFRYSISIGNQIDLTAADYLEALESDSKVRVFGVYVEGFRPLDGLKFITVAKRLIKAERSVILYRSGRTSAGASACASHTASIAGDYPLTETLCRDAGILTADNFEDFEDLLRLKTLLSARKAAGLRLGALSNAGFECVAFADHFVSSQSGERSVTLAQFSNHTTKTLEGYFGRAGISNIVDIHNPLDVTPMSNEEAFIGAAKAVIADESVDVAIIGCVPLTPALNTTPGGPFAQALIALWNSTSKPWVLVIEGGFTYDEFVSRLTQAGVPVFRKADRAAKILRSLC